MVVDWERAWLALKEEIVKKRSHSAKDLALSMAQIEVDCRVPEGQEAFDPAPPHQPTTDRPLHVAGGRHG